MFMNGDGTDEHNMNRHKYTYRKKKRKKSKRRKKVRIVYKEKSKRRKKARIVYMHGGCFTSRLELSAVQSSKFYRSTRNVILREKKTSLSTNSDCMMNGWRRITGRLHCEQTTEPRSCVKVEVAVLGSRP